MYLVLLDPLLSYIIAMYWIVSSAFCVGFGDIGAIATSANRKIAIFVIFSGSISTISAVVVGR
jgi:hypothetical protein